MQEDHSKKFQTTILNLKKILREIQQLGINTSPIETIINKLEAEAKEQALELYTAYETKDTEAFYNELLFKIYHPKITRLEHLYNELLHDYNNYYIIKSKCTLLTAELTNSTLNNISENLSAIKTFLNYFHNTAIKDTDLKDKLIDPIYQLIYLTIKVEFLLTKQSTILDYIKLNDIDTSYLESYILKEIDKLDLKAPENKEVYQRLSQLRTQGLNFSYLDESLIQTLLSLNNNQLATTNNQIVPNILEETIDQIFESYQEIELLIKKLNKKSKEKEELKTNLTALTEEYHQKTRQFLKKSFLFTSYLTLLAGGMLLGHKQSKNSATTFKYLTTIEKYDAENDCPLATEVKYTETTPEKVEIIKYSPWYESSFYEKNFSSYDKFNREVLVYDVTYIDYENLKDYLSLDLVKLGVEPDKIIEDKPTLTPTDLTAGSFTIVKKTSQNPDDYQTEFDSGDYILYMIILLLFELISIVIVNVFTIIETSSILKFPIKDYKKIKELNQHKKVLLIKLKELINKENALTEELNYLYQTFEQTYLNLPIQARNDVEIKSILKKVKKLSQGDKFND